MVSNGIDILWFPRSARMSKWLLSLPVYIVLLCCFALCRAASRRARARASPCLVHHCDFSSVCSCVLPSLLWSVCLLFEAFDLPQWFHVFSLLVYGSSTFPDFKPYQFHISRRAWSLEMCLKQLREAKKHETIVEGQRLRKADIMERKCSRLRFLLRTWAKTVKPTCTYVCLCKLWSWECVRHRHTTPTHTPHTHNTTQHREGERDETLSRFYGW